jgi:O-antigen ligase
MKRILDGKIKLIEILLLILACYPLIKLNYTSILFVAFCALTFIFGLRNKELSFTKANFKRFGVFSLFYFLLIISIFYSENSSKGVNRIVQQLPLLLAPLVIIFFGLKLSEKLKTKALNVFLISNIIYVIVLLGFYIYYWNSVDLNSGQAGLFVSFDRIQFILSDLINSNVLFIHKAYFSMGFVLSSVFALSRSNHYAQVEERWSYLYFILFLLFSLLVVYTFSFPNVIALVLCVFFFIIFESKKKSLRIKKLLISTFVLMTILISGMFYLSGDTDIKRGVGFIESILFQKSVEGNDPRIEIYKTYDKLLQKSDLKDLIFGFGVGDEQLLLHRTLEERLLENKTKNLLSFNEEFNADSWFRNNLNVVTNAALSPVNTKTAEALVEMNDTDIVSHNISTDLVLEKDEFYTFSVFARKGTSDRLIMRLGKIENRAYFNLTEGSVSKYEGLEKATVEKLDNGWLRCSITVKGAGKALLILGLLDTTATYNYKASNKELYVWGAQVERRSALSNYVKNSNELMEYAYSENLNSHNNYLYFLISVGIVGLSAFLLSLFALFRIGLKNKNSLQWSFCVIIALNFLTENILSRQSGLMFVSILVIILFSELNLKKDVEESL